MCLPERCRVPLRRCHFNNKKWGGVDILVISGRRTTVDELRMPSNGRGRGRLGGTSGGEVGMGPLCEEEGVFGG
jgi:hypothetical protein